jgi:hypothetical protein
MNALTQAFYNACTNNPKVFALVERNDNRLKTGWNAKLSYRTHQALLKDGYSKFSG